VGCNTSKRRRRGIFATVREKNINHPARPTEFVVKFKSNAFTCHSNILIQHIVIILMARRLQQFVVVALTV
jgi:hypothetical protein